MHGNDCRQTAHNKALGVNQDPFLLDLSPFGRMCMAEHEIFPMKNPASAMPTGSDEALIRGARQAVNRIAQKSPISGVIFNEVL
jgi:hypothetical protein